jgi:hypothetical protein
MAQLAKHFGFGIVVLSCLWALYVDVSRSWQGGANGRPIHEHPTLHAAGKHRWLPRPSKYGGRRHTKRASRLDWSWMGGRARVELRKTSQQAFPPRS